MARFSVKTDASEHLQEVFTKNIRVRMALYDVRQTALAEAMHLNGLLRTLQMQQSFFESQSKIL